LSLDAIMGPTRGTYCTEVSRVRFMDYRIDKSGINDVAMRARDETTTTTFQNFSCFLKKFI